MIPFRTLALLGLLFLGSAEAATLIEVNGEAITTEDIDAMIMDMHRGSMGDAANADLVRLLDKAVNDRLLVQDALAMGMDEEPSVKRTLDEFLISRAVEEMVRATFRAPGEPDDDDVRAEFDAFYHRVRLRQVSLPSEADAAKARAALLAGADMDSLAKASSLDVHRFQGGLHNEKPWADVELPLREAVSDLPAGSLTEPFPYRDAFALVRVEERQPPREEDWSREEPRLRRHLRIRARDQAWAAYLDSLRTLTPVVRNEAALSVIRQDADALWTPDFVNRSSMPALMIENGPTLTEEDLRRAISRTAMENGTAGFDEIFDMSLTKEEERLLLRVAAEAGGWTEDDRVRAAWRRERDQTLINAYLQETIVPKITFRRDEFQEFYEEHAEDFRGPEEVRLEVVVAPDEATAREMEARLAEGADFEYVRDTFVPGSASEARWAPTTVFSDAMREQLATMETGDTSTPIPIPSGWMIFRLVERRDGALPSLEDVEMKIREVMFQRHFNDLMDEHLGRLREHSEIVRHEERIHAYFSSADE